MLFFETMNPLEAIRLMVSGYGIWIAWGGWQMARSDITRATEHAPKNDAERSERARRLIRMNGARRRHFGYLVCLLLLFFIAGTASATPGSSGVETFLSFTSNLVQIVLALILTRLAEMDTHDRASLLSVRESSRRDTPKER